MIFKAHVFDEPMLEFGDGGQHCDPRQGLREHGPLQPRSGDTIRVGIIGTDDTVAGFTEFLGETGRGIESGNKQLINLNPDFPGLGNQNPFRCRFEVPDGATGTISRRQVNEITRIVRHDEAVRHAVEMVTSQLSALVESSAKPDVIVLALPIPLIEKLVNAKSETEDSDDEDDSGGMLNFRDLLKAKTLHLPVPTQIVWPDTWDDAAKIPRKVKRDSNRQTQVKATRAWNLLNALFYKAGKVPWRLLPDQAEYRTSFLGIGFYRDLDGQQLWTSTAQMFDERGRGLILRGARAQTEARGRHPYLTAKDAEELVVQSITAYKAHHRHVPARLVVLKTSRFRPEEAEGIDAALGKSGIEMSDLVWVQESSPIAIFRDGNYPVLRGTFVDLGSKGLLYTRGSVPFYGTFPGLRVPRPLLLVPHENSDSKLLTLAKDVLALTKVNWNTTQFDQKLPAPIKAAREVGRILKYVEFGTAVSSDFRRYT
ncbi:argonaute/piwi family protein [Niveispirillum sp. KHB5.9]|uniref:argonaute/piwi family protein n=1 Tax=Niveispirillum sp. KHB5.9 TaxID=3400269 RepID=UPI003A8A65F9